MPDGQVPTAEVEAASVVVVLVAVTPVAEADTLVAVAGVDRAELESAAAEVESASAERASRVEFHTLVAGDPASLHLVRVHHIGSLSIPDELSGQ